MVEDNIEGEFELTDEGLSRLDKLAAKARKKLSRRPKPGDKKFIGPVQPSSKKTDTLEKMMASDLGTGKASKAISFLSNPVGSIASILTTSLPILGGILAAFEIVKFITAELTKKGGVFDTFFKDNVNTLVNALRDKIQQSEIKSGIKTQLIFVTASGSTNPRDAYNSFEQFNNNQEGFESDFEIRRTSGFQ